MCFLCSPSPSCIEPIDRLSTWNPFSSETAWRNYTQTERSVCDHPPHIASKFRWLPPLLNPLSQLALSYSPLSERLTSPTGNSTYSPSIKTRWIGDYSPEAIGYKGIGDSSRWGICSLPLYPIHNILGPCTCLDFIEVRLIIIFLTKLPFTIVPPQAFFCHHHRMNPTKLVSIHLTDSSYY